MSSVDYVEIAKAFGGELVAGDMIVRDENGRAVSAGRKEGPTFVWSDYGLSLVKKYTDAKEAEKTTVAKTSKKQGSV